MAGARRKSSDLRPGASGTADLVGEIQRERSRRQAEARRRHWKRLRKQVLGGIAATALVVGAGGGAKHLYDLHRVDAGVELALTRISTGTPGALDEALTVLDRNLRIVAEDAATLRAMALIRARQVVAGSAAPSELRELMPKLTGEPSLEQVIAGGVLALVEGDVEAATVAAHTTAPALDDELGANARAWLLGLLSRRLPEDTALVKAARQEAEALCDAGTAWPTVCAIAADLRSRDGNVDGALAAIEAGRAAAPDDLSLSVDEALHHALSYRELDGVKAVAASLIEQDHLPAAERARVRVAQALVALHEAEHETAQALLDEGWHGSAPWDLQTRILVVEAALGAGAVTHVERWLEHLDVSPERRAAYGAWLHLARGDAPAALEALARLPQDRDDVALLQTLALVEPRRWDEAKTWAEYARKKLHHRLELEVASARIEAATGDPNAALERLTTLAAAHPYWPRVWTGVAEARIAVDPKAELDAETKAALEHAIDREPYPAEALLLLARDVELEANTDPKRVPRALDLFARAAEANPHVPRYLAAHGAYLARLGELDDAEGRLRAAIERPGIEPGIHLQLVTVALANARRAGTDAERALASSEEIDAWLDRASAGGADAWALELARAEVELVRGTDRSIETARARAARYLEHDPRSVPARALHARILLAQGDLEAARATLREGIRRTPRRVDGPLYLAQARVEAADGNARLAASLAFKGWKKMVDEPRSPGELREAAPYVIGRWLARDNASGARSVARDLTDAVPWSAEAWILRGRVQLDAKEEKAACTSAAIALDLAPDHVEALGLRGDCLVRMRDVAGARKAYARAAELADGTAREKEFRRKARRL